jgi:hypothetical protein
MEAIAQNRQIPMLEEQTKPTKDKLALKNKLLLVGEVVLVLWVLGIFYYFYQKQGFFELVQQVFSGTL